MKDKTRIEYQYLLANPLQYYLFLLFVMIGGWKTGQDVVDVLNGDMLLSDIITSYIGLAIGSIIVFLITKRRAKKMLEQSANE